MIDQRPPIVEERTRIGDWEMDTVIGRTGGPVLVDGRTPEPFHLDQVGAIKGGRRRDYGDPRSHQPLS